MEAYIKVYTRINNDVPQFDLSALPRCTATAKKAEIQTLSKK